MDAPAGLSRSSSNALLQVCDRKGHGKGMICQTEKREVAGNDRTKGTHRRWQTQTVADGKQTQAAKQAVVAHTYGFVQGTLPPCFGPVAEASARQAR